MRTGRVLASPARRVSPKTRTIKPSAMPSNRLLLRARSVQTVVSVVEPPAQRALRLAKHVRQGLLMTASSAPLDNTYSTAIVLRQMPMASVRDRISSPTTINTNVTVSGLSGYQDC